MVNVGDWYLAVMFSIFGTSFLLLYATKVIDSEGKSHIPLKIFLFIMAFYFIYISGAFSLNILQFTDANNHLEDGDPTTAMLGNFTTTVTTAFQADHYLNYAILAYIFIYFIYWIIIVAKDIATRKPKWRDEEGGIG